MCFGGVIGLTTGDATAPTSPPDINAPDIKSMPYPIRYVSFLSRKHPYDRTSDACNDVMMAAAG